MGVVNVTPDSFSDGGRFLNAPAAIAHGLKLAEDGADIIDIGGESTRPGARPVLLDEELRRVLPAIQGLAARTGAALSIDTRKPEVARAAVAAGASIWNDVSALTYARDSLETAAALGCRVVLMHAQNDPRVMQDNPTYGDVVGEVRAYLAARIDACLAAGVRRENIIIDPGVGFGKTVEHNLALIAGLDQFLNLGFPVLLGVSRKRFIAALDPQARSGDAPESRLGGTLAAVLAGWRRGASIVRVHDAAAARQALNVARAIENANCRR
jgi:dihydropteroate synthase